MTRRAKWLWMAGSAAAAVLAAAALVSLAVVRSEWFATKVRERLVQETERATGGRAELQRFDFDWKALTATVRGFTLHGTEPEEAPPLFQAETIQVQLRILSAFRRKVDLARLRIVKPSIYILVRPDGSTNVPRPKVPAVRRGFLETVLDLRIKRFEAAGGHLMVAERRLPLDVIANALEAHLAYDVAGPRYEGRVQARELLVAHTAIQNVPVDLDAQVAVEKDRILLRRAGVSRKELNLEMAGSITRLAAPVVEVSGKAAASTAEILRFRSLPLAPRGRLEGNFRFTYSKEQDFLLAGTLDGSGLIPRLAEFDSGPVRLRTQWRLSRDLAEFVGASVNAEAGTFRGGAEIRNWRSLSVRGRLEDAAADDVAVRAGRPALGYPMMLSGPIELNAEIREGGLSGVRLRAALDALTKPGGEPVEGRLVFTYDQTSGALAFEPSYLRLASTEARASGSLDQKLSVEIETQDLKEVLRAAALFGGPETLPLQMRGGRASFRGAIRGALHAPRITGRLHATRLYWEEQPIDEAEADLSVSADSLEVRRLTARQNGATITASGKAELESWKPAEGCAVEAKFEVKGATIQPWLKAAGSELQLDGVLNVSGKVSGTFAAPQFEFRLDAGSARVGKEQFDRFQGSGRIRPEGIELLSGAVTLGKSVVRVEGSYAPSRQSWKTGLARVKIASDSLALERIAWLQEYAPGLRAAARLEVDAAARVDASGVLLRRLDGALSSKSVHLNGKNLGAVSLEARSRRETLKISGEMALRGSRILATAEVTLDGDYPAQGEIRLEPVEIETLFTLAGERPNGPPATGVLRGKASFTGPLRQPAKIKGSGEITRLEIKPREILEPGAKGPPLDLTVHNEGPIPVELANSVIRIKRSRLTAQKTDVFVEGYYAPGEKSPLEVRLRGDLNLATLRGLRPELRIGGTSAVDVVLRGSIQSPDVAGKLELKNASLFLADVPNGLDNANGVVTFDQNRITVQQIKAESGGGRLALSGFLGLGGDDLTYRLQATAERVRIRYPEGFSTLLDAKLSFTGTRKKSLLAGTATVLRSSFAGRTDLASLFQPAAQAVAPPVTPSEFLRGLQFDIQLVSGPGFEIQTAYTQNVQAEARLQLRGTAAKPSLLGRLSCGDGEVDFLGTRYRINRAEISFYNTAKIEPVLDVSLETRIRGISVNISLSGAINRMNVTYRSDPPLPSTEILALLTVGRTPASDRGVGVSTASSQDPTAVGSAILGQAISAPFSGRLQRFFGVSRLKIDPLAKGIEGTQQARVTVEQQISRDVTLTYVTSLQRVEQQIVRVEINLNRQLSLVALRDENGAFGIDFFYRKRLR